MSCRCKSTRCVVCGLHSTAHYSVDFMQTSNSRYKNLLAPNLLQFISNQQSLSQQSETLKAWSVKNICSCIFFFSVLETDGPNLCHIKKAHISPYSFLPGVCSWYMAGFITNFCYSFCVFYFIIIYLRMVTCGFALKLIVLRYSAHIKPRKTIKTIKNRQHYA